jgi:tripartite ATP-independent transporter DctP family solute receptor
VDRRTSSFLVVGFLIGSLVATTLFAWYIRDGRGTSHLPHARVLRLGHALDERHPVHRGMEFLAERLRELSGDRMAVRIYPNGQLGGETEYIEQLQRGALAMTKVSAAPLESFEPTFAVFGIPYIFRDEHHYRSVLKGPLGREMLLAAEDMGLRGLCYYDAGERNFYTVRTPILKPDDLRGLKIRVQPSRTAMDMVQVLGGAPTPISFGELYTALQTGTVDGAENNLPSFHSSRHFEVCRHVSLDSHTRVPDVLMISTVVWDSLSNEEQGWLQQAADESASYQRDLWAEETVKAAAEVERHGVTIHHPDRQAFIDRVRPLHESYRGTKLGALLERVQESAP